MSVKEEYDRLAKLGEDAILPGWSPYEPSEPTPLYYVDNLFTCRDTDIVIPKERIANLEWRSKVLEQCQSDPGYRAFIYEACSRSIVLTFNLFFWTYSKRDVLTYGEKIGTAVNTLDNHRPFITRPRQDALLLEMQRWEKMGINGAVDKSRDEGVSWLACGKCTHGLLFVKDRNYLLVSRKEEEVDKRGNKKCLFWKVDYLTKSVKSGGRMPEWLVDQLSRTKLHIDNVRTGSTIDGESTNQDVGRGDRRDQVFIDESAAIDQLMEITETLDDTTLSQVLISTPKAGTVHNLIVTGQADDRVIELFDLGWEHNPEKAADRRRDPTTSTGWTSSWYEKERRKRSSRSLAENIDRDKGLAGSFVFPPDLIRMQRSLVPPDLSSRLPTHVGDIVFAEDPKTTRMSVLPETLYEADGRLRSRKVDSVRFSKRFATGAWRLWIELEHDMRGILRPPQDDVYLIFADPGGGQGEANSAACVVSVRQKRQVGAFASAIYSPQDFARILTAAAIWFGGVRYCKIGWESNGVGGAVTKILHEHLGWPSLVTKRKEGTLKSPETSNLGWFTTDLDKHDMCTQGADMMWSGNFTVMDDDCLAEMSNFIISDNGTILQAKLADKSAKARATHGDRGIAAMGAAAMLRQATVPDEEILDERERKAASNPMTMIGQERILRQQAAMASRMNKRRTDRYRARAY